MEDRPTLNRHLLLHASLCAFAPTGLDALRLQIEANFLTTYLPCIPHRASFRCEAQISRLFLQRSLILYRSLLFDSQAALLFLQVCW